MNAIQRAAQYSIQTGIEAHLDAIEEIIGPGYAITLVCRYKPDDGLDKDILLTLDDAEKACATIRKMVQRPICGKEEMN